MRMIGAAAIALMLLGLPAHAQTDSMSPKPFSWAPTNEDLPVGDGGPPTPEPSFEPSPPATARQIEFWRRDLVGKPVFGPGGGRIGTVTELSVGLDSRVIAAVVTVPNGARLPVRWAWVENQIGGRTVVVPWSAADITWLQQAGRR